MTEKTIFYCDAKGCNAETGNPAEGKWAWLSLFDDDGEETESFHVCSGCIYPLGLMSYDD